MKGIWAEILGQEAEAKDKPSTPESEIGIDRILSMRLSELARRNIALKIHSSVLGCEIWLCGTEEMANQLRRDDPETTAYTASEMRRIMSLNPAPQCLINIHIATSVFPRSKVVDSRLKEMSDGTDKT